MPDAVLEPFDVLLSTFFAFPLGLGGKPYSGLKGTDGALHKRYIKSLPAQLPACWLVSTSRSHLSMPRAMSVKRSAVSASFSSLACLLA